MYSIFTQDSNDLTCEALVASLSVYKDILDLEQLYHELKTWYVFKRTHFHNETSNLDQARTAPQEEVDDSEDESDSSQEHTQEKPFIHRLTDFFINHNINNFLPCLTSLLKIYLTIPVSSATAERSFSCLKCLKTYLRNSMGQLRLSDLAVLSVNKEFAKCICINSVIDSFAEKNRKIQFTIA